MKWETVQHLDLRRVGRSAKPFQPHAAAFHPTQAIVAAAAGTYITEFDAYTGTKIASMDIGSPVVRMAYSPTGGNCIIAVLEDCTIRSCDFDTEQTCVLHSPEKKRVEQISVDTEVHLAMTPLQPILFFGFHRRMSVTVVGTVIGGKAPTKIKTDLKKPVVNLACHPRLPVLYVTYADGLVRGYNIHTYTVSYTLQIDNTVKLIGAGAFAFHPTLEWIFIGDRCGKLLAWDVSTERPMMIGITQVGSQPISSVGWLPMLGLLVTLSKDGSIQVWKTLNQNRPPNFFETAASESIDIPHILSQRGGEAVHALPQVKALEIHPRLNLAAIVFASMDWKNRAAYTRQGRKQLFAVLQSARGSSASVLKEKLTSLGSSVILADHQLQAQLQEHHSKGQNHITISDIARKAFLYSHFMEGHFKFVPITRLPLITILDNKHLLRYLPVCQPFHLELNFFSKENRVLEYPVRAFYLEGPNLMAYNLASGVDNVYKKLYTSVPATVELHPKNIAFSQKKHLFLAIYELSGATHEVTLYWENTDPCSANSKATTIKGRAAAFIGPNDNHFVILDEDKTGLRLYTLPEESSMDKNMVDVDKADVSTIKGPVHFMLESEVDCIFNTPQESTLIFVSHGDQIGLAKLNADGSYISTKGEGKRSIKLKANEMVLQVHWQATLRGFVAGILTTQTVLIVSADLDVLACSCTKFDKGLPSFRSLLWVGPALLFSTTTSINMLGWDGKVRTILCICMPNAVLVGALNDRLLLANPTNINPRQKKRIEIKSCLVGFLEPLLIGFATMQQRFEQKLELSEVLYQITSRFDSLRITPRSLDILASGSPVCGDLAVSLSQSGPQFTQVLRGSYAIKALGFSTALSILKDEFLRSRDYPRCPPTSHLFHRFRQLGRACIRYGQFDCAKETFEVISDYESMLDLFICHLNPSAMRRLAQTLEEGGGNSELRRYCERILRVGCTGWSTFGNFAAESMAPKQPEWGGGNWEIKTRTNIKDVPQWPLAAEVIPYMRNDNGTIPTIVPDHIGVYMGIIKGRGNVIEVREDRLVKADIGASGLHEMSQSSGSHAVDEQTKVAEEFKKSILYGSAADDSSSDEEEGSKTKRLQIKIKPVASTSVDVDKIKQATKQLNLDLPLGRTNKSLAGDHGLISSQTPATIASRTVPVVSAPSGLVQPTPFSQSCLGVAAGPIPEDFFQNTISPYQVVKSLPPSGNYLSRLDQSSQGNEVNKVIPNQGSAAVADSISSGAVPVQATQQPPVFGESIGVLQPARLVQSQITQVPVSTKPLDLSSSGKVPASPKAVRPGHVPRGAPASVCFETGLAHLEQNQLPDALSCFDEAFLALAKDQSRGVDIKARATINGQYKIAVTLLQEINRLQKVGGSSAKDEMARLSRHLGSLPLRSNHRRNCIRTAIKRNMDVQNYAYSKQMLELLLPETPAGKQGELRSLIDVICERGVSNKTIDDALEDPSQFCAATLGRLSTIGYDVCDQCKAKFSALSTPGCIICGMGSIRRSDALPLPSPFLADIYSN